MVNRSIHLPTMPPRFTITLPGTSSRMTQQPQLSSTPTTSSSCLFPSTTLVDSVILPTTFSSAHLLGTPSPPPTPHPGPPHNLDAPTAVFLTPMVFWHLTTSSNLPLQTSSTLRKLAPNPHQPPFNSLSDAMPPSLSVMPSLRPWPSTFSMLSPPRTSTSPNDEKSAVSKNLLFSPSARLPDTSPTHTTPTPRIPFRTTPPTL